MSRLSRVTRTISNCKEQGRFTTKSTKKEAKVKIRPVARARRVRGSQFSMLSAYFQRAATSREAAPAIAESMPESVGNLAPLSSARIEMTETDLLTVHHGEDACKVAKMQSREDPKLCPTCQTMV